MNHRGLASGCRQVSTKELPCTGCGCSGCGGCGVVVVVVVVGRQAEPKSTMLASKGKCSAAGGGKHLRKLAAAAAGGMFSAAGGGKHLRS